MSAWAPDKSTPRGRFHEMTESDFRADWVTVTYEPTVVRRGTRSQSVWLNSVGRNCRINQRPFVTTYRVIRLTDSLDNQLRYKSKILNTSRKQYYPLFLKYFESKITSGWTGSGLNIIANFKFQIKLKLQMKIGK